MITLAALEEIIDASGIAPQIEAVLPIGVRSRQLRVRTLLAGMCLTESVRKFVQGGDRNQCFRRSREVT